MMGTFANIRIRNEMVPGVEGDIPYIYRQANKWRFMMRQCSINKKIAH